jgi:hypothetical protein
MNIIRFQFLIEFSYQNPAIDANCSEDVTLAEWRHLMESLHPLLKERVSANMLFLGSINTEKAVRFLKAAVPGTHSEIIALNNALKAKELRLGRPLTEADLNSFILHNRSLIGPHEGSLVPPPCVNCSSLTGGIKIIE